MEVINKKLLLWAARNPFLVKANTLRCPEKNAKFQLQAIELRRRLRSFTDLEQAFKREAKAFKYD